jgi:uncharacterized SAM-binding protein YcdF (DUF218 family)
MFFVLSKLFSYLTTPLVVVCILLLLSAFMKRPRLKRCFFWLGLCLLLFFSNDFIANEAMLAWELKATPYNSIRRYDIGIVLTGATMSGLSPHDRVYFARGADRVTHTVQLYKLGLIKKIIASGGSGRLIDTGEKEALDFKEAMVLMGIPRVDIITESDTRNTHESAVAVKKIIDGLGIKADNCLLITSAFHMRRSLACYQKVGLQVDSFTTDFYTYPRNYSIDAFIVPKVDAIVVWHKLIREWVGYGAYAIAGYL